MRVRLIIGLLPVCVAGSAAWAQMPLNNAFTYQGRLKNGGSPANGAYDLRFLLFDADVGGTQLGATLCANNVSISDGLITQTLNFGPQFAGDQRFLEVQVRADTGLGCGNPAGFVVLTPRQSLTATPNAIYSINAGRLDGLDSTAFLQSVPVPLTLSGNDPSHIISGQNASNSAGASGVRGVAGAPTGATDGVFGQSNSTSGVGVFGLAMASSGFALGGSFQSNSSDGRGVYGYAGATSGLTYGGYFESRSTNGFGVQGLASSVSGLTVGGSFQSSSPSGLGVYGYASATSGTNYGGYFESRSDSGYGVYGYAPSQTGSPTGGYFQSDGPTGYGVQGLASAATGANAGVFGRSNSSAGYGVRGLNFNAAGSGSGGHFESNGTGGRGVYGLASDTTGANYGVYGESPSPSGIGVYGHATATAVPFPGSNYGVYGRCESQASVGVLGHGAGTGNRIGVKGLIEGNSGFAVFGESTSTTGSGIGVFGNASGDGSRGVEGVADSPSGDTFGGYFASVSTTGRGVYGQASSTTGTNYGAWGETYSGSGRGVYGSSTATGVTDVPYGVRGFVSTLTNGYAVFASGDMGASGTKPFRIDHPCDPENKYLLHYASESPAPQNFYSGNVVTDGMGYAWVELPDYFEEINTNFKYQLTVLDDGDAGQFVQAKVSQKILANRFQIRTGAPNVEVSWRVEADRNDLYVRFKQPRDVQHKMGVEKGKYQHPGLYGQPPEMGMDFHPRHERESHSAAQAAARN